MKCKICKRNLKTKVGYNIHMGQHNSGYMNSDGTRNWSYSAQSEKLRRMQDTRRINRAFANNDSSAILDEAQKLDRAGRINTIKHYANGGLSKGESMLTSISIPKTDNRLDFGHGILVGIGGTL